MRVSEQFKIQIFAVVFGTLLAMALILTLYGERAAELVDAAITQRLQVEVSPSWEITVHTHQEPEAEEAAER